MWDKIPVFFSIYINIFFLNVFIYLFKRHHSMFEKKIIPGSNDF